MNNKERLIKIKELNKRASKLGVSLAPVLSYSTFLNNKLIEEGIARTICKAYYKYILQFWFAPVTSPLTSTVENLENMFIKSFDNDISLRCDYRTATNLNTNDQAANRYTNDWGQSVIDGFVSSVAYSQNIVLGVGIGPDDINRHTLVSLINWSKAAAPNTSNLTYDETTGIYEKVINASWRSGASDADRVIREVGLMYDMRLRKGAIVNAPTPIQRQYLFDRAQLDVPITVKKTDTLNVSYTIRYQVPWHS